MKELWQKFSEETNSSLLFQNIYNMIQLSYMVEEIFPVWLAEFIKIDKSAKFCVHDVCAGNEKKCGETLPAEMKQVRDYLIEKYVKKKEKSTEELISMLMQNRNCDNE